MLAEMVAFVVSSTLVDNVATHNATCAQVKPNLPGSACERLGALHTLGEAWEHQSRAGSSQKVSQEHLKTWIVWY
jgi:hypothetical protein